MLQTWAGDAYMRAYFSTCMAVNNGSVKMNIRAMTTKRWRTNGCKRGSGSSSPPQLIFPRSWYSHTIFCNSIMLMQSHGNGFANRSTVSHSYGILSKEYIGVKCGQMCGMNQCSCNNLNCPGRQAPMAWFWTRLESWTSMDRWSTLWVVGGSNILVATGHLWQLLWIFSTWIILLLLEYRKKEWPGSHYFYEENGWEQVWARKFHPFHLDAWVPLFGCVCVFVGVGLVLLFLVGLWYPGFLQITACPLHIQENQWPTRLRARSAMAQKKRDDALGADLCLRVWTQI